MDREAKQWRIPSVKLSQCKKSYRNKLEKKTVNVKTKSSNSNQVALKVFLFTIHNLFIFKLFKLKSK